MNIVSLGYTCYVKSIIQETDFKKESDIFDWINSFEFNKNIKSIENKFNIFENLAKSHLNVDSKSNNVFFNTEYCFRLPHETNFLESSQKYKRRYERFINYKNSSDKFVFIRQINRGRYGIPAENIENNYNDESYEKIISYLPEKSKILLISDKVIPLDEKNNISDKFFVIDDIISPEHIAYGNYLKYKKQIVKFYNELFEYIKNNFDYLNVNIMKEIVSNKKIGIYN